MFFFLRPFFSRFSMSQKVEDMVEDWVSSLPTVYFKLKEAIDDPESSFKDLADIINFDPGLTARLLRIVNSPFYGFSSKVETISHALTIVGVEQLSDLILSTTVNQHFRGIPKELVDMELFWRHSICCGVAAKRLAAYRRESNPERFYVAGMLHDIGSLVIFKKRPVQAKEILTKCKEQNVPLVEMERKIMGYDHAQVGGTLLNAWKLPKFHVDVVTCHHNPFVCQAHRLEAGMIHVADIVSYRVHEKKTPALSIPAMAPNILGKLGLTEAYVKLLEQEVMEPYEEAVKVFLGP